MTVEKFILALVIVFTLSVGAITFAFGHGWYDHWCCGDQDCKPVSVDDVVEIEDGKWKYLPTGNVFNRNQVYPSKDGRFHVCIGVGNWNKGHSYCIYIVQGS